jgi:hypothetical protein
MIAQAFNTPKKNQNKHHQQLFEMNIKLILIVILPLLLSSCSLKKHAEIELVSWNGGSLSFKELNLNQFNEFAYIEGKDELRDMLLKKSFKAIFFQQAQSKNLDKSKDFIAQYSKKRNSILTSVLIQKQLQAKIDISDKEILSYFKQNISEFSSSDLYDIYVNFVECTTSDMCQQQLDNLLKSKTFKQLCLDNPKSPSGHFEKIPLSKLNKNIQDHLKELTVNHISKPLKINNKGAIFILINNIVVAKKPQLQPFKNHIRRLLNKEKLASKRNTLKTTILKQHPQLINQAEEQIFAQYAIDMGIDKEADTQLKLKNTYNWLLADFGYFDSELFADLNINTLRKELSLQPKKLDRLSRFDISYMSFPLSEENQQKIIVVSSLINNKDDKILNNHISHYPQISRSEFHKQFIELKMDPLKLPLNQWKGPITINNEIIWIKKTYQGLATNDTLLIKDYKKNQRSGIGGYSGFMQSVGKHYNIVINPKIYTLEWSEYARDHIQLLHAQADK